MRGATQLFVLAFLLAGLNQLQGTEQIAISSDGVAIHFDSKGTGDPSIVLVHGWANDRTIWEDQVSHFSSRYRVVTIDLAGFGQSGSNRQAWTMSAFGNDVAAVVEKLGLERVVLVGFSMGAAVVLEAAASLPNRSIGIVLVDALQDVERQYAAEELEQLEVFFTQVATDFTLERMVAGGFVKKNPQRSYQRLLPMLKGALRPGWLESFHGLFHWYSQNRKEAIRRVRAPIRAINAEKDPTNVEAFKQYAPSFEATIIPDTGHVVFWDAEEEFNSQLEAYIQEFIQ